MPQIHFKNFRLLEPAYGELRDGYELLVEGARVCELSETPIKSNADEVVDCGGRTLMPGLIDCHVHVIHSEVNIRFLEAMPLTLLTARAGLRLRAMLDRGFTTVRDTGGCDWGIKTAVEQGYLVGAAPVHCRHVDRAHRRACRWPPAHGQCRRLRLLQRAQIQIGGRRRHRRGAQGRPRTAAAGCRPCEDHDVG